MEHDMHQFLTRLAIVFSVLMTTTALAASETPVKIIFKDISNLEYNTFVSFNYQTNAAQGSGSIALIFAGRINEFAFTERLPGNWISIDQATVYYNQENASYSVDASCQNIMLTTESDNQVKIGLTLDRSKKMISCSRMLLSSK
jgi:hypothetical protein